MEKRKTLRRQMPQRYPAKGPVPATRRLARDRRAAVPATPLSPDWRARYEAEVAAHAAEVAAHTETKRKLHEVNAAIGQLRNEMSW